MKYKAWYGGSGKPSIIAAIETYLGKPVARPAAARAHYSRSISCPTISRPSRASPTSTSSRRSGKKFAIDSMYGAGRTILSDIFKRIGVDHVQIRGNVNPLFPGINPEPIEPHIRALGEAVVEYNATPASAPTAMPTASAQPMSMATSSIRTRSSPCC